MFRLSTVMASGHQREGKGPIIGLELVHLYGRQTPFWNEFPEPQHATNAIRPLRGDQLKIHQPLNILCSLITPTIYPLQGVITPKLLAFVSEFY